MLKSLTIWMAAVVAILLNVPGASAQDGNTRQSGEAQPETIPLFIEVCGADLRQGYDALVKVLSDTGVKVAEVQELERKLSTEERVVRAKATIAPDLDLYEVAKRVNEHVNQGAARDDENAHAHGMYVVLFAKLDGISTNQVSEAIARLPGLDARECRVDAAENSIFVKFRNAPERKPGDLGDAIGADATFTRAEKVTVGMILMALKDAGIEAKTEWTPIDN